MPQNDSNDQTARNGIERPHRHSIGNLRRMSMVSDQVHWFSNDASGVEMPHPIPTENVVYPRLERSSPNAAPSFQCRFVAPPSGAISPHSDRQQQQQQPRSSQQIPSPERIVIYEPQINDASTSAVNAESNAEPVTNDQNASNAQYISTQQLPNNNTDNLPLNFR